MWNKKKNVILVFCFVASFVLSSCGIFGNADDSNKNESNVSTEKQETESIENGTQGVESTETESTKIDSTETEFTEVDENVSSETESEENSSEGEASQNLNKDDTDKNKPGNNESNTSDSNKDKQDSSESNTNNSNNNQSSNTQTQETEEERLAREVVNQIIHAGMSDFEKVITIHDWLTFNIDYDFTYSNYDVASTLKTRKAVCQGYALTFEMMAEMAGLEAAFISGSANNGSGYDSHAWNRVKVNGTWYNLDATWDDPAQPGKDPADHSANRYDYFLVSDAQINKNHIATGIPSDCGACPSDYDRLSVLRYAVNSGKYGNVALATNAGEVNAAIETYMNRECTSFWLWYYNGAVTADNMWNEINVAISASNYPASTTLAYPPENALTKYQMSITPMSQWNSIPVVTNGEEFENLHNTNLVNSITQYTVRYESATGSLDFGYTGGFSYSYSTTYRNGTSYLLTITVQ